MTSPGSFEPVFSCANRPMVRRAELDLTPNPSAQATLNNLTASPLCVPLPLSGDSFSSPPPLTVDNLPLTSTPKDINKSMSVCESNLLAYSPMDAILPEVEKKEGVGARKKLYTASTSGRATTAGKTKRHSQGTMEEESTLSMTDLEDDDTEEFTRLRRRRKEKRYSERLTEKPAAIPLYLQEGNKEFVMDFNSCQNVQKGLTYHKYTTTLFRNPQSWLTFVSNKERSGDFFLNDLVDWDGPRLRQPGEVDQWLETVPDTNDRGTKK